jgi:outer membrane protein assembly factor BamB
MSLRLLTALTVLAGSLALAAADKPTGGDWPMFGGTPSRNMVNTTARGLPTEWGAKKGGKNVKWVADVSGNNNYLPVAVASGQIYVATSQTNLKRRGAKADAPKFVLACFRESDGQLLWQNAEDLPQCLLEAGGAEQGLLSTPAIEGDRLYYVTPGAEAICADTKDGKSVWRLDMMKELKVSVNAAAFCSPLVVGDLVFVVTGNGKKYSELNKPVPEPKAPSFVAIHKKTGKVAWSSDLPGDRIMEGTWTSPVYAEVNGKGQMIFSGGDGWLYALTPEKGELIWRFDGNLKGEEFKPGKMRSANYLMAPAVLGDRLYAGTGQQPFDNAGAGRFWCVDLTKAGDLSAELGPGKANPNSGAVWQYGGDAAKGADRTYLFARSISTPAVHDGLVYTADIDGFVYCFDAADGKLIWEEDLKSSVLSSPLCVDGKVYVGDNQGNVHVFAHGKEKKLLNKVDMDEGINAAPVVANGVLYVLTDKHLFAIGAK